MVATFTPESWTYADETEIGGRGREIERMIERGREREREGEHEM